MASDGHSTNLSFAYEKYFAMNKWLKELTKVIWEYARLESYFHNEHKKGSLEAFFCISCVLIFLYMNMRFICIIASL